MASILGQKDYFDFVKSIGEAKSKQEEDRIILDEVILQLFNCDAVDDNFVLCRLLI
jgi:hypothetical protein